MYKIIPEMRTALADAAKVAGGQRALERKLGLATGHLTKIIHGKVREVTAVVMGKINQVISASGGQDSGIESQEASAFLPYQRDWINDGMSRAYTEASASGVAEERADYLTPEEMTAIERDLHKMYKGFNKIVPDHTAAITTRAATLGKLLGRAEAAIEIIDNDAGLDFRTEIGIIKTSLNELYTAARQAAGGDIVAPGSGPYDGRRGMAPGAAVAGRKS